MSSESHGIYVAAAPGRLPPEDSPIVATLPLPPGRLIRPQAAGGRRGPDPVMWISEPPISNVVEVWSWLARAFSDTGLWPLIMDAGFGIERMGDVLMDVPSSVAADPFTLLRGWWDRTVSGHNATVGEESLAPFDREFPGLAPRPPGERPTTIEPFLGDLKGYLGLVAVDRPAGVPEAIGWMGPANHDIEPTQQSAILDSWEDRFDAYLVGLGFDTLKLIVGRPPTDVHSANRVAAEHLAFCPDIISQGFGSISQYAPKLVGRHRWDFWWD